MPLHIPGYNYCGPGTTDFSRDPVNALDAACRVHDSGYTSWSDYFVFNEADQKLLENISDIPGPSASLVRGVFMSKRWAQSKIPFPRTKRSKVIERDSSGPFTAGGSAEFDPRIVIGSDGWVRLRALKAFIGALQSSSKSWLGRSSGRGSALVKGVRAGRMRKRVRSRMRKRWSRVQRRKLIGV